MVIFGHRRGGVQPPKNPEITFFKVKFSNSRGGGAGSGPPVPPPLDPRMLRNNSRTGEATLAYSHNDIIPALTFVMSPN